MDLQRQLRIAIETGDVTIGLKESMKAVKTGKTKLIITASNLSDEGNELIKEAQIKNIPVFNSKWDNIDLGLVCRRKHPVLLLAVRKPGDSEILDLSKSKGENK